MQLTADSKQIKGSNSAPSDLEPIFQDEVANYGPRYHIKKAYVVSNARTVQQNGKVIYIPIYYVMFLDANPTGTETLF